MYIRVPHLYGILNSKIHLDVAVWLLHAPKFLLISFGHNLYDCECRDECAIL